MLRFHFERSAVAAALLCMAAAYGCSASSGDGNGFTPASSSGETNGSSASGSGGGDLGLSGTGVGAGVLATAPPCEGVDPNLDNDGDGFTGTQGDCNDCTDQMNPGAQDYAGNNIDEDCNGAPDDNPTNCDAALQLASTDPVDGARAMGLCKLKTNQLDWGLVSAAWVKADGTPLPPEQANAGYGILGNFGPQVNPQEGAQLLALSSGAARRPTDPGYVAPSGHDKGYTSAAPPGYPKPSPSCGGVGDPSASSTINDSAGLQLQIQTPTNAKSLSFNLNFYTYEFPIYICSAYNDFFVAMMTPIPAGQSDGNISFDSQGNTISVNAGFLEVCTPQQAGGKDFPCALGTGQLGGTGFDEPAGNSAATGWLQTTAPIEQPGQTITLLFTIWDTADGVLDSTILLDNFAFEVEPSDTATAPVPTPK